MLDSGMKPALAKLVQANVPLAIKIAATGGAKPAYTGWNSVGEGRLRFLHRRGLNHQRISKQPLCNDGYVPISHDARYFSCSGVSVSIVTPIARNLSCAIALSICSGTA